jgi:hypothetical protein
MGIKKCCFPFVWLLFPGLGPPAVAKDPPAEAAAPQIPQTQLTLRLNPLQGRATVVAIAEQTLTIVTAAHFLSSEDAGRTIQIYDAVPLRGRIEAVTRNPGFRPLRSRVDEAPSAFGTMGVDTAVALIKVDLRREVERRAFAKIRAAEWARDPVLRSSGQILSVHIVDQYGQEHIVRAGNHLNPRSLAWGRQTYDTKRGDSGAGVFLVRQTPEGQSLPILIGNVSQTDDRGGIASLAHRNEYWVVRALARLPPESK